MYDDNVRKRNGIKSFISNNLEIVSPCQNMIIIFPDKVSNLLKAISCLLYKEALQMTCTINSEYQQVLTSVKELKAS